MSRARNENDVTKKKGKEPNETQELIPKGMKRRHECPGKRRYKTKCVCCAPYSNPKINLCNRNWTRISVFPFINFLRKFRRRVSPAMPPGEMARRGRCMWKRLSCKSKKPYYEQAARARARGFRS